jgi:hypothetical protein
MAMGALLTLCPAASLSTVALGSRSRGGWRNGGGHDTQCRAAQSVQTLLLRGRSSARLVDATAAAALAATAVSLVDARSTTMLSTFRFSFFRIAPFVGDTPAFALFFLSLARLLLRTFETALILKIRSSSADRGSALASPSSCSQSPDGSVDIFATRRSAMGTLRRSIFSLGGWVPARGAVESPLGPCARSGDHHRGQLESNLHEIQAPSSQI